MLNIIYKKINEIKPYEKNPRKNDKAVESVAESISEFGFKVPIVIDTDGVIVAGHTRYKAAKKLKMNTVPCIIADDLSAEQIKAFRLADNKVSEFAEWDFDLLNEELDGIFDIDMGQFGFDFSADDYDKYSYIDDLENEMLGEKPKTEPKTFAVTFDIDILYQNIVLDYIKNNGKNKIISEIVKIVGGG